MKEVLVTPDQAKKIVERDVLASKPDCALVADAMREYSSCFTFVYQSKKFVETGNHGEMLVGHGPVLVSRADGRVFETGSAHSLYHYVEAFEACGDPFGRRTEKVKVLDSNPGANKSRAIQAVRDNSDMGLSQAKAVIDQALSGQEPIFAARSVENAEHVVVALKQNGFVSMQLWSNQC